jgi:two-component system alkaline phosphatase synthesis response regulator PhoP
MSSSKQIILIVEDEDTLGQTLKDYLQGQGFNSKWAKTVKNAELIFNNEYPQIVLMDIGLPDGNGLELAKKLRKKRKNFVLLFLSAWNDPETKLEGLEIGADDYITKPFALKELSLRLKRILKFQTDQELLPEEISIGNLKIWFKRFEVQNGAGKIIILSQKECHILELLFRNKNEVVSRENIIDQVWGENAYTSNRTIDNYIVNLRKWCDSDSNEYLKIHSIRGVGYKMTIDEN